MNQPGTSPRGTPPHSSRTILYITQFAILLAIEAIVCFTPLGSLPAVGPIVATLSHIPVIIAAIMLGTKAGAAMGFFFGLFSFLVWTLTPPAPTAFAFTPFYSLGEIHGNVWSLVICFVPRILIGVVAGLTFRLFIRVLKGNITAYAISGVLASLTNTLLVLGGIYLFFGKAYAQTANLAYELLLGAFGMTILTSGIPEAIIGGVLACAICRPLKKYALPRQ